VKTALCWLISVLAGAGAGILAPENSPLERLDKVPSESPVKKAADSVSAPNKVTHSTQTPSVPLLLTQFIKFDPKNKAARTEVLSNLCLVNDGIGSLLADKQAVDKLAASEVRTLLNGGFCTRAELGLVSNEVMLALDKLLVKDLANQNPSQAWQAVVSRPELAASQDIVETMAFNFATKGVDLAGALNQLPEKQRYPAFLHAIPALLFAGSTDVIAGTLEQMEDNSDQTYQIIQSVINYRPYYGIEKVEIAPWLLKIADPEKRRRVEDALLKQQ
jgi:hypothetical protein